jgi:hypothetical protein
MSEQNECSNLTTIGLSLATLPFLGGLLAMNAITQELLTWGENSEEIFRGDRLPLLNFPDTQETENP